MPSWTLQAVEKAAPDTASLTAARKLAGPGPWSDVGSTDTLVWGKCQGSGKTPYQVSIDTTGPAYRCSCPSRKFPCKHALALMMQFTGDLERSGAVPQWAQVTAQRAADDAGRQARKPADPQARAKRIEQRRELMNAGIEDFARWMTDLVRGGLAAAGQQPADWWERTAARLVDAQLPGLAERVRRTADDLTDPTDDPTDGRLLTAIGSWWLAVRRWQRFDDLDQQTRSDLRVVLGWHLASDDVRAADSVTDRWSVLGAHRDETSGPISEQRTWLRRESTGEFVQILDFGAQGRPLPVPQLAGSLLSATLSRYPGHTPRRALFAEQPLVLDQPTGLGPGGTLRDAGDRLIELWQHNPWAERVPCVLTGSIGARPASAAGTSSPRPLRGELIDNTGDRVVISGDPLPLLALSGGHQLTVFGELERKTFRPLTADLGEGPVPL